MKRLRIFTWIVLINIYLVVIAGSVVRMTGSGMGCPDWPQCFGYMVPPTQESQLDWGIDKSFEKGQMVIYEEALWEAKSNFTTKQSFSTSNWEKYTKHDYAKFNVYHTWTEYVNRLFGALLGFFALILVVLAARKRKVNKGFLWLALGQLFLIGFEAWLGKLTVDTNLNPNMITYHMIGVTVMIIVQLLLLKLIKKEEKGQRLIRDKSFVLTKNVILIAILLMIVQIVLGTQVRQQTDVMMKGGLDRSLIANGFDYIFYIHRSFSFLIVFAILFLFIKLKNNNTFQIILYYLIGLTMLEILAGIILYYFGMQSFAQPIHLLLSLLLFGFFIESYLRLKYTSI